MQSPHCAHASFQWRGMQQQDLPLVSAMATRVHPDYPEDDSIFAERLALYPEGCLLLEVGGEVAGYAISHPWLALQPPALGTLLRVLPIQASTYYIHDVALLPAARGLGAAAQMLERLTQLAKNGGIATLSLVAVNDSHAFWMRQGFGLIDDPVLQKKLNSYDYAARFLIKDVAA